MKDICACLLFFASTAFASFHHLDSFHETILRVKRETAEDGSVCLMTCIENMEEQLGAIKSVHAQQSSIQQSTGTCQRYDSNQLTALCGSHSEAKRCLEACPEGEMRSVGMNALVPLNFMCLDRIQDFKQHLPCLDSICDRVESACHPVCLQYKRSVDKLTDLQRDMTIRQSFDKSAVMRIVSDACEYIECFNECSRPLITNKCGSGAADLQRDTVRKAFSSISNFLSSVQESEEVLPNSCQSLIEPVDDGEAIRVNNTTRANTVRIDKTTKVYNTNGTTVVKGATSKKGGRTDMDEVRLLLEEANMLSSGGSMSMYSMQVIGTSMLSIMVLLQRLHI